MSTQDKTERKAKQEAAKTQTVFLPFKLCVAAGKNHNYPASVHH